MAKRVHIRDQQSGTKNVGIRRDNEPDHQQDHYLPTQIKSATGNSGGFDAATPDICFSRSLAPSGATSAAPGYPSNNVTPAAPPIRKRVERHIYTSRTDSSR
jgi:hypothetical protein